MTMRNAFANLATEAGQLDDKQLQEAILYALLSMLEKMPRLDVADRMMVSHAESNPTVSIAASQTIATVTTLGNQTNIGGRDASNTAFAMANIGTAHIYNNIQVS